MTVCTICHEIYARQPSREYFGEEHVELSGREYVAIRYTEHTECPACHVRNVHEQGTCYWAVPVVTDADPEFCVVDE